MIAREPTWRALMAPAKRWVLAFALLLPAASLYLGHYGVGGKLQATGFIQCDMPYYLAHARECFDRMNASPAYALPYSANYDNPAIYFQPHLYALGLVHHASGLDPGAVFVAFGLLFGVLGFRVAVELYARRIGLDSAGALLGLLAMAWGGGLLWLSGMANALARLGLALPQALERSFDFDPAYGWWCLNLGRTFILPAEAYYHALFLGTVLALLLRRWLLALAGAWLLAGSHPFSGSELLAIVGLWSVSERLVMRKRDVPLWFIAGIAAACIAVAGYYGVFLGRDPEHSVLVAQWALPWLLEAGSFIPAYALVAVAAFQGRKLRPGIWSGAGDPFDRLCVVWAATAFLLANHEWFIKPHQPLHFTRGYIWLPLFLLGARWLRGLLDRLWKRSGGGRLAALALLALALLDNGAWLTLRTCDQLAGKTGWFLTSSQRALFDDLQRLPVERPLIVAEDADLAFLAMTYTPFRSYYANIFLTPNASHKKNKAAHFFETCTVPPVLEGRELLVIARPDQPRPCDLTELLGEPVLRTEAADVFHVKVAARR